MANTRASVHVSLPIERLFENLILGAESLDKGMAQVFPGYQKQVSLDRFYTSNEVLEVRSPKFTSATLSDYDKDQKQILMEELQMSFEIDPKDYNLDSRYLWASGPAASQTPSPELQRAIESVTTKAFNNQLENVLWNGGVGSITGWVADIGGADPNGTVTNVTGVGAVDAGNVQTILQAMKNAMPANVRDNPARSGRLAYLTNPTIRQIYGDTLTEELYKNNDTTNAPSYFYQGYEVMSSHAVPADTIFFCVVGGGDQSALKAAVWMDADRFNVTMGKGHDLDDVWGVKVCAPIGTASLFNGEIVKYDNTL